MNTPSVSGNVRVLQCRSIVTLQNRPPIAQASGEHHNAYSNETLPLPPPLPLDTRCGYSLTLNITHKKHSLTFKVLSHVDLSHGQQIANVIFRIGAANLY